MVVFDMSDLMGEDRLNFFRREVVQQAVGEKDVAKASDRTDDSGGTKTRLSGFPDQDFPATKLEPLAEGFQTVAQRPGRERFGIPGQTEREGSEDCQGRQKEKEK